MKLDPSDYAWTGVVQTVTTCLIEEGAGDRPLSFRDISDYLSRNHRYPGDASRAGGWDVLTEVALGTMKKARVAEERVDGWVWTGNGRTGFKSLGRPIPLPATAEEREHEREMTAVEQFGALTRFEGLPKRPYEYERMSEQEKKQYNELLENIRTFGFDRNFPILVNEEGEIVAGRTRKMACDELGLDWRDYTKQVERPSPLSVPLRNVDDLMRAVRDNVGRGMSVATKNALRLQLHKAGMTERAIAAALNESQPTTHRRLKQEAVIHMNHATADPAKIDDKTAADLTEGLLREDPDLPLRYVGEHLRDRHGIKIGDKRVRKATKVARSRIAAEPHPEPKLESEESSHEHVWACTVCGERHPGGGR